MLYLLQDSVTSVWAIREDSYSVPPPAGAIPITQAQYQGILNGTLMAVGGVISTATAPYPSPFPPYIG